jgi:hypothetical protein
MPPRAVSCGSPTSRRASGGDGCDGNGGNEAGSPGFFHSPPPLQGGSAGDFSVSSIIGHGGGGGSHEGGDQQSLSVQLHPQRSLEQQLSAVENSSRQSLRMSRGHGRQQKEAGEEARRHSGSGGWDDESKRAFSDDQDSGSANAATQTSRLGEPASHATGDGTAIGNGGVIGGAVMLGDGNRVEVAAAQRLYGGGAGARRKLQIDAESATPQPAAAHGGDVAARSAGTSAGTTAARQQHQQHQQPRSSAQEAVPGLGVAARSAATAPLSHSSSCMCCVCLPRACTGGAVRVRQRGCCPTRVVRCGCHGSAGPPPRRSWQGWCHRVQARC